MDEQTTYLMAKDKESRMALLNKWTKSEKKNVSISIALAKDLLSLKLDSKEKFLILSLTSDPNKLELELFLTEFYEFWDQNLASQAIDKWAEETDHLLWHRFLPALNKPHTPQRVTYKILHHCSLMNPKKVIEAILASDGFDEFSPALQSLLLKRSLQWHVPSPLLTRLAHRTLEKVEFFHPLEDTQSHFFKIFPWALVWMAKHHPEKLEEFLFQKNAGDYWHDLLLMIYPILPKSEKKTSIPWDEKTFLSLMHKKTPNWQHMFAEYWPPLWERENLTAEQLTGILNHLFSSTLDTKTNLYQISDYFAGCLPSIIHETLVQLRNPLVQAKAADLLKGYLRESLSPSLLDSIRAQLGQVENPETYLSSLPPFLRIQMQDSQDLSLWDAAKIHRLRKPAALTEDDKSRNEFFDVAFRKKTRAHAVITKSDAENFWKLLLKNWEHPSEKDLTELSSLARKNYPIFKLCYIRLLQEFKGNDIAVLKLLDVIRSHDENEVQSVIYALSGIGSPRALQELIALITRPNISFKQKVEISELLKNHDLSSLQPELRSTIDDLSAHDDQGNSHREIKESLSNLLIVPTRMEQVLSDSQNTHSQVVVDIKNLDLDKMLEKRIATYQSLSSEVKRSLRTAEFFYKQIESFQSAMTIDLSPVIDMQYKALELYFREAFEEPCAILINKGILQRKLDLIGYARPIEKAMTEFEDYLGAKEVICDIPYFSKFKLRKLLRALCLFRPGKRFTLDGIKAFALFFFCFGRRDCRYGLANLFPLPFKNDVELAEFCKGLHIFQDFRNRAAHEGFRPQARDDMEGLWQSTAEIIATAGELKNHLAQFKEKSLNLNELRKTSYSSAS